MNKLLKNLVTAAAPMLREEHRFRMHRNRFVREDELMRSVWFDPQKNATLQWYTFDILFDLGIPGISTFSSTAQEWVVRAYGNEIHRDAEGPGVKFEFLGEYDEAVEAAALRTVRRTLEEFLLRYRTPEELYRLVRDCAVEFAEQGMRAENEFKRLQLAPWNVVPRLELAAVYAAFLGHDHESAALRDRAVEYAAKHGIDYAIPRIRESVARASAGRPGG